MSQKKNNEEIQAQLSREGGRNERGTAQRQTPSIFFTLMKNYQLQKTLIHQKNNIGKNIWATTKTRH